MHTASETPAEKLPALQTQLAVLETERQIAATELQIQQIVKEAEQGRIVLMEAFGDWVNPQEYLHDDPSFGFGVSAPNPYSLIDDRSDGKYVPVFRDQMDLARIRGAAHILATSTSTGVNILDNLNNYTVSSGFTYEAKPAEGVKSTDIPDGLIEAAQKVIDTFLDDNKWQSDCEREIHHRSREDGEANVALMPCGWRTRVAIRECDQILQPANSHELEDWLMRVGAQVGSEVARGIPTSWSFGVHTPASDCSHHLGYHSVSDTAGNDWDYFPANDVPLAIRIRSGVMEQIKRNVPANVKRGVSDFYPVISKIERSEKLSTNIEMTAAIQAAIAFIRNHPKTATQTQIQSLQSGNATSTVQRPVGSGGSRTINKQQIRPGTIIDTNGTEYMYGPMGQSSAPTFIDVLQSSFRGIGSRWCMPEYMISSDASNNNFASILVAGSPFVQARYADQRFYISRHKSIMWKVQRIAYEGGFYSRFNIPWETLEALIDILVSAPDIVIADDLKNSQIKQGELASGVLSKKTYIKESGRDVEEELGNLAEEGGVVPAVAGAVAGTSSLADIVGQVASGAIPIDSAKPIMIAAFPTLPQDTIDQIIAPLMNFTPTVGVDGKPLPTGAGVQGGGGVASGGNSGQGEGGGTPAASGEFGNLSTLQLNRNFKAIDKALSEMIEGKRSEVSAEEMLVSFGLDRARAKVLIKDKKDNGVVEDPDFVAAAQESLARDAREKLPPGMSLLHESAYVAALETATPEERTALLAKAWEGYP